MADGFGYPVSADSKRNPNDVLAFELTPSRVCQENDVKWISTFDGKGWFHTFSCHFLEKMNHVYILIDESVTGKRNGVGWRIFFLGGGKLQQYDLSFHFKRYH